MALRSEPTKPQTELDYANWTPEQLISRISDLERQINSHSVTQPHPASAIDQQPPVEPPSKDSTPSRAAFKKAPKPPRDFDPSKYNTRFIALKFAYLGQRYCGYEHANGNPTPLSTIEEELYRALRRTKLINPQSVENADGLDYKQRNALKPYTLDWNGCDYSKCGRTDRGVSSFGQVVGIRVRSNRSKPPVEKGEATENATPTEGNGGQVEKRTDEVPATSSKDSDSWDDIADELPYLQMLNSVLPDDIRMLAWCPNPPPDFNARFSCSERRYRYFFTQPAFSPTPGPLGFPLGGPNPELREGWLDIEAMREACKKFVGRHDFRNFCKLDPSKQISNFERVIYHADIEEVDPRTSPLGYVGREEFSQHKHEAGQQVTGQSNGDSAVPFKVYTFTVHGSAFLWHQVRHMATMLFTVGQGLEAPSIITELFDVEKNPQRPQYELASDAPLVLWDCVFSRNGEDALDWIYVGDQRTLPSRSGKGDGKFGMLGTVTDVWSVWRQRKMDEILAGSLLDLVVRQGDKTALARGGAKYPDPSWQRRSQRAFFGEDDARMVGKYVPMMQRRRMEPVEVINARWLKKTGRKPRPPRDAPTPSDGDE